MIWFTADTHFNHTNIIKYCNRPFSSISDMNATIIDNINKNVVRNDTLWILGDFAFGREEDIRNIIRQIRCSDIRLIIGSHDRVIDRSSSLRGWFNQVIDFGTTIRVELAGETKEITLCHYAMQTWPKSHYRTWHLFGHSHGKLQTTNLSFDVGVDNCNYRPISLVEVTDIMRVRYD
jgi:calcineurin-like phosphoesterase family protein